MSHEDSQRFEVGGSEAEAYLQALLELNNYLETTADSLNSDYAEDLEDSSYVGVRNVDRGAGLTTEITFEAKKFRDLVYDKKGTDFGLCGEVIANEYTVTSTFTCKEGVTLRSFPQDVQEYILADYPEEYLEDETTEYGIGLVQLFTITSGGEFDHEFELRYYIDGVPFSSVDDALDEPEESVEEDTKVSESGLALNALAGKFSAEDLAFLGGFGEAIIREHEAQQPITGNNPQKVLAMFLANLPSIQFASQFQRLDMVKNIVRQIQVVKAA
jgi:hypothetical protein